MVERFPRVSIGLPVFNGENYLEAALQSILAQTFEDFELIISDNASTDCTEAICRKYAAKDSRIRYYRQPRNLGAIANYNYTFQVAKGEYFKWAAHDDLLHPQFIEKCVEVLDQKPEIILAFSHTKLLDTAGNLRDYQHNGILRTTLPQARRRFHDLVHIHHYCFPIFGLMRSQVLAQTELQPNYGHADGVFLARLVLMGKFYEIPEPLFISRQHPEQATTRFVWSQAQPDYYAFTEWMDGINRDRILLPRWRMLVGYFMAVWENPVNLLDWLACYLYLVHWVLIYRREMQRELHHAAKQIYEKVLIEKVLISTILKANKIRLRVSASHQ